MNVRMAIWRSFAALGLDVRRRRSLDQEGPPRGSMAGALRQLARLGLAPNTVIDVGAAPEPQTQELYDTFPRAAMLLIEPLVEFEPALRKICASYNAQYVLAAAGERSGVTTLNVHPDLFGSSLLNEVEGAAVDGTPREVPVVTIDELCAEKGLRGPYVIKADVQGAELQVLAGATRTLPETEAVILEVSLFWSYIGAPEFYDVISKLKQFGFVAYDVFGFLYRPLDHALSQLDVVFVREDGAFRKSHAYATTKQREVIDREMAQRISTMQGNQA